MTSMQTALFSCVLGLTALGAEQAFSQDFIFERTSTSLQASTYTSAVINGTTDSDWMTDTDTQPAGIASASVGSVVGGLGGDVVMHDALAQSTFNLDNQPVIQSGSEVSAGGLADVRDWMTTFQVEGYSYAYAYGTATAELVQLNGSGGSTDVRLIVEADASAVIQTGQLYSTAAYGGASLPTFFASMSVNGSPIHVVYTDTVTGDIWYDDGTSPEYLGNTLYLSGFYFESDPISVNDGASVTITTSTSALLSGATQWACYDTGLVDCTMSAALTTLP